MRILDYMEQQYSGRDRLPFLRKDMYNRLGEDRRSTTTKTDSEGALCYLTRLAIRDRILMKKTCYTRYFGPTISLDLITKFLGRFWLSTLRTE